MSAGMPWNPRLFGKPACPIHKSDLEEISGPYGCPRRFKYRRDAEADGASSAHADRQGKVSAKTALGSAVHEAIARALTHPQVVARVLAGPGGVTFDTVRSALVREFNVEVGGRDVDWGKDNASDLMDERAAMVFGLLDNLHRHVAEIIMVEPAFTAVSADYVTAGHVDLLYRPRAAPSTLAITDWKTGAQKPHAIKLAHGWESGLYSNAVHSGAFIDRKHVELAPVVAHLPHGSAAMWHARGGRHSIARPTRFQAQRDCLELMLADIAAGEVLADARTFHQFPSAIYHVHLGDYVPYEKAGKKEAKRPEDLIHYNLSVPAKVSYVAGDLRGPAWLPVARTEHDIPRLEDRLRTIVGTVRMGRFLDIVDEHCIRCSFKLDCLTRGYAPRGEELAQVESVLREAGI